MLQQFTLGTWNYGFVEGKRGFIVTQDDFIHAVYKLTDTPELISGDTWSEPNPRGFSLHTGNAYTTVTLDEIKAQLQPIPSLKEWGHYWGIKDRVQSNYNLLLKSMHEIGASTKDMPRWGK